VVGKILEKVKHMKGIILAGGSGTRLNPLTTVVGKQLLPVYDKPMIYYPLSTLILAGVDEVLLITTPQEISRFTQLLGDGSQFGIEISYQIQESPKGLAQGVQLASKFTGNESFWFILGDNLFHGPDFGLQLQAISGRSHGAHIFAYRVSNPSEYGVVRFSDSDDSILELVEKPIQFVSNWAIPGIYFFDNTADSRCLEITPSSRGELEIIDLIKSYANSGEITANKVSRGNAWFDLGTPDSLLTGAQFVQLIQSRQGMLVGSPEEASFRRGFISKTDIQARFGAKGRNPYEKAVTQILQENH
jgi:glucose-1-phosphate thymidylyltransferase